MEIAENITSKQKNNALWLTAIYFSIGFLEITAEFFRHNLLINCTKPLLIPLLTLLYTATSVKKNFMYMLALLCVWIGNLFFLSKSMEYIVIGTLFFSLFRILLIVQLVKMVKFPEVAIMILACIPFLFIYIFVINLTYDQLGELFYLFAIQGIFMIVFGGISLAGYILTPNKANMFLVISMMCFTFTQFLFIIRQFYMAIGIFQPILMLLFISAHFLLYKFMQTHEKLSVTEK